MDATGVGLRRLSAMTSIDAATGRTLLVPIGATEQHGPHLPLTTDTDIAVAVAERAAERAEAVDVAPPVAYGSSSEHQAFAGTLSVGAAATELQLLELGRSATCTWRSIVFVVTHGGNQAPVAAAVSRLRDEGRSVRSWSPRWGGDAHAGHTETSLMLALDPERVDREAADVGATERLSSLLKLMRVGGVVAVSANGILGDARTATAEAGRALLNDAVEDLLAVISGEVLA